MGADVLSQAFRGDDFTDIITILESSLIIDKVLKEIEIGKRYFYKENYKTFELYKTSPFIVDVEEMSPVLFGKKFFVTPVTSETFKLELKAKSKWSIAYLKNKIKGNKEKEIVYSKVHKYSELVNAPLFKIKVKRVSELSKKQYFFQFIPNQYMAGMIKQNISAEFMGRGSSVLRIRYNDTVALRAQDVVTHVVSVFLDDQIEEKNKETDKALKFLDGELKDLSKNLNKSADKLKSFKQENEVVGNRMSFGEIAMRISTNKQEIRKMEVEKAILENVKIYMENNQNLDGLIVNTEDLSNTLLTKKVEKYQELQEELNKRLLTYTEFHPEVIKINDELSSNWKNIIYIVSNGILKFNQKISSLKKDNTEYKVLLQSAPQKEFKLSSLTRDFSINNDLYAYLLQRRAELAMLESSSVSSSRIIESPSFVGSSYKPKRMMIVITGAILGFLFGSIFAFILHLRDDTIKDIQEVESMVELPFFGLIPKQVKNKYTLAYEEAFRTLRTNLEFVNIDAESKVILVASAISGEGKSTTLKNLAEMLIKLNKKVIVLDFDLRRPSLHNYFMGVENSVGISTLLSGQSSLHETLQVTKDNINILSAGPIPPNPSELIMSENSNILFQTLSKSYDYILIDSPPYTVVTDAKILIQKADITLFCMMVEHTRRDSVKALDDLVEKYAVKSAGIVYNGVSLKKSERHGYGYFNEDY